MRKECIGKEEIKEEGRNSVSRIEVSKEKQKKKKMLREMLNSVVYIITANIFL